MTTLSDVKLQVKTYFCINKKKNHFIETPTTKKPSYSKFRDPQRQNVNTIT